MIYKTLKKVSNVCQLLDKSKYPATQTVNGVTFTNNGDGTITANGTATDRGQLVLFFKTLPIIRGKGLIIGDPQPGYALINYMFYNNKNEWIGDNASYHGNGVIFTGKDDAAYAILYIAIEPGSTANNLIFKPQLFDLTEMYGAGNEPTTVEQFRQDFPDEMYDYKPYCFVKSYKNCLTCTTKNLFDISKVPIISGKLTVKDNSICSYDYPVVTDDPNLLSIFKSLKPNTNYTMSATTLNYLGNATNYIVLIFSNLNDEKNIFYNYSAGFNKVTFSLTQEQINNITYVYFYGRDENSGGPTMWSNIQLEEGSTATEYQPYGYIQSRKKSLKVSNSILL